MAAGRLAMADGRCQHLQQFQTHAGAGWLSKRSRSCSSDGLSELKGRVDAAPVSSARADSV
jgi:hypothetical protein